MTFLSLSRITSSSTLFRGRLISAVGITLGIVFVAGLPSVSSNAAFAQTATPPANPAAPAAATDAAARNAWRKSMAERPLPKNGCFTASYPNAAWQEVPCGRPSPVPNQGRNGGGPNLVGNGADYVARSSEGLISSATGSFLPITNVTGVNGVSARRGLHDTPAKHSNPPNNVFMLQINTQSPNFSSDGAPHLYHPGLQQRSERRGELLRLAAIPVLSDPRAATDWNPAIGRA